MHATLKFGHASLQFSDSPHRHTEDLTVLFGRGYDIMTFTEAGAGANNTNAEIRRLASLKGYAVALSDQYDTAVAIKKSLSVDKKFKAQFHPVFPSSAGFHPKPVGKWGPKAIASLSFNMGPTFGRISVGALHYVTTKAAGRGLKRTLDLKYALAAGKWAKTEGAGTDLAFVGLDANLDDQRDDMFYGQPLTSCWDELKFYPDTVKGATIDAVASYDRDGRVKCVGARVLNDAKIRLNMDHFLVEAEYSIGAIKRK